MGTWVEQDKDTSLPIWLADALPRVCKYCGSPMLNYYNDYGRCTNRKCSNSECYGFVAAKADFARKILKVSGIGFQGCLKDAEMIKAHSPFQLFKLWGMVPHVTLGTFLRMHCFEGIDNEWDKICQAGNIFTLDELYERYDGKWKQLLIENKEQIYENAQYVVLAERPVQMSSTGPDMVLNIMITGTPIGFNSKDDFINTLNLICKGRIVIQHQKTKRQSGVDCLIREPGSTTRGKVEAAQKGGIPILTSEQFIMFLTKKMLEFNSEAKSQDAAYINE